MDAHGLVLALNDLWKFWTTTYAGTTKRGLSFLWAA